jgi:hypothetical protein
MGGEYTILHPGLTRNHHVGLIVPFLCAISPMILTRLPIKTQVIKALVSGVIMAICAYILMRFVPFLREDHAVAAKATLLGLIVAELMVFTSSNKITSIVNVLFFLFMYFYGCIDLPKQV